MAISINCATKVISVPKAYLTLVSGSLYEMNVNTFRLDLKDWEDSDVGMAMPDTHRHNVAVTLAGTTYAQTLEIINGYTVTFEDGSYSVRCVGANHNIGDVKNVNSVSLIIGNSAGMIVASGGLVTAADVWASAIEGGLSAQQLLRIVLSALAGRTAGIGTASEQYKSQDGATNRIDAAFDGNGNRTSVAVNGA